MAGRIAAGRGLAITYKMQVQQPTKTFCNFMQKRLAKNIAAVYQSVFGQDAYPSSEEKAANLLYFMIKDHPYADGCKRIAASLFLEFLDKNNALFLDGEKRLSDGTLVAITLMIAESKPEEKEVMVKLVMNLLKL